MFTLSPPECYMEIRNGYGTSGTRVAGMLMHDVMFVIIIEKINLNLQAQFVLVIHLH